MLLSIQQRYILDTLRKLRSVRADQLLALTRGKFHPQGIEISERRMEAMLRQLRNFSNDLRRDGELIYLAGAQPDSRHLEALDVMLELSQGTPGSFGCDHAPPPFLLRFSVKADGPYFAVGMISGAGGEHLPWLQRGGPGRVIWISDSGTPPDGLSLPSGHFFAVRRNDGTHRFYGSTEP